jgi:hypothetical protein
LALEVLLERRVRRVLLVVQVVTQLLEVLRLMVVAVVVLRMALLAQAVPEQQVVLVVAEALPEVDRLLVARELQDKALQAAQALGLETFKAAAEVAALEQ